jgi:anti-sigma factor RsiW
MAMIERFKSPNDDIEALLPWYEKGTLPAEDARRVEEYLASNPEGLRFLELIREEVGETIAANEQAGMPPRAALDRLMDSIAAESKGGSVMARRGAGRFLSWIFGEGSAPWLPAAALAACLLILVQAVSLGVLLTRDQPIGPGLASGDPTRPIANAHVILVRFSPDATAANISTFLRSFNAVIVDGPKPGATYRVQIAKQPAEGEQIEAILQKMRARSDIINFVSVSR